jgi:hypothetical protein
MNYGEILKRAWDTIWKHKILWLFGLLASCTANSGGGGGGGGSNTNYNFSNGDFANNNPFNFNFEKNFDGSQFFHQLGLPTEGWIIALIIIGLILLMIILSVLFIAIGSAGQIGLSRGSWLVDEGEPKLTFSTLWQSIKKPFWRVFLIHFILGIAGFLAAVLVIGAVLLIAIPTLGVGLICAIPFLCIFGLIAIVAGIFIYIMMQLMIPMMVNEDVPLVDAVKKSFALLKQDFWHLILMGLILWIMNFIVSIIIAIPIVLIVLGAMGIGALTTSLANMDPTVLVPIAIACMCVIVPIATFIDAVLQAYLGAAWTITYRRITGREFGPVSLALENIVEA